MPVNKNCTNNSVTLAPYQGNGVHTLINRLAFAGFLSAFAMGFSASAFAQLWPRGVKEAVVSSGSHNCPIRLSDPYGGRLDGNNYVLIHLPYRRTGLAVLSLSFQCLGSDDAESQRRFVFAKYDNQRERWEPDFSALSSDDVALLKPVTKRFDLRAVNSSGVGVTQDAVNGDPETRDRSLGFCLRHPPVMLCGSVPAVVRPYYSKVGLMPYVLTLLKSIEFVDGQDVSELPSRAESRDATDANE